jgi:hypothetical protein
MIHTLRVAHELYVFYNGRIIYKRWFYPDGTSYGRVMHGPLQ